MAFIGNEIVQSRVWLDPNAEPAPNLNYKHTFPITVFDAVRKEMADADSITLTEELERIDNALSGKQSKIPAKSPDNLVTYGGIAGIFGSIKITDHIPFESLEQSNDKIPTEKAVGDLLRTYGVIPNGAFDGDLFNFFIDDDGRLIIEYDGSEDFNPVIYADPNGNIILESEESAQDLALTKFYFSMEEDNAFVTTTDENQTIFTVFWNRIIGKPEIVNTLGDNPNAVVNQAAITSAINALQLQLDGVWDDLDSSALAAKVRTHILDIDNPHAITPEKIGAVSITEFSDHQNSDTNPHHVTKAQVGLSDVDNTSDIDKPISKATQLALDHLSLLLTDLNGKYNDLHYLKDMKFTLGTGRLELEYNDGSLIGTNIPIAGLVDDVYVDVETNQLAIKDLNGDTKFLDLQKILGTYIGSAGAQINVTIGSSNSIRAEIIPGTIDSTHIRSGSLLGSLLADKTIKGTKIADLTITTTNLANGSVTTEKIADGTITGGKIKAHSITGANLFTTKNANSVLAVGNANTNAQWMKITDEMIADSGITGTKLAKKTITADRIDDNAIVAAKINNGAVITEKIANGAVTGDKLDHALTIGGNPTLAESPAEEARSHELVDAAWVRWLINHNTIGIDDINPRSVTGRHLFSSPIKNRALVVTSVDGDAEWGLISAGMLAPGAVTPGTFADGAVITESIAAEAVTSEKIAKYTIREENIAESGVGLDNIVESEEANTILAVGPEGGHPKYSKVFAEMIANDAIGTENLQDGSITVDKIASPEDSNTILGFDSHNKTPSWIKITEKYISNGSITAEKMFTSPEPNMVLAAVTPNAPPVYTKVTSEMLADITLDSINIADDSIKSRHIAEKAISSKNLQKNIIASEHIQDNAVTVDKIDHPEIKARVLGYATDNDDIDWVTIETAMIDDHAVTFDKLPQTEVEFTVLGSRSPNSDPSYIQLTEEFFIDGAIGSSKLKPDLIFTGNPRLADNPSIGSNDHSIPTTKWVRDTIQTAMLSFPVSGMAGGGISNVPDHYFSLAVLQPSAEANRVVGVIEENGNAEYVQVNSEMVENGAITSEKIERNTTLLGSPSIEVRPPYEASDLNENGNLIPDVQWVKKTVDTKIEEYNKKLIQELPCFKDPTDEDGCIIAGPLKDTKWMVPMSDATILALIEETKEANGLIDAISLEGMVIDNIDNDRIDVFIKRNLEWVDPTSPASIHYNDNNGEAIVDLDNEDENPDINIVGNDLILTSTNSISDLALGRISLSESEDGDLIAEYSQQWDEFKEPLEVAGTMVGEKFLEPIDISRIRGLITGEIIAEKSGSVEVTHGINTIEDDEHDYKYIVSISTVLLDKLLVGTADPEPRADFLDNDGNTISSIDEETLTALLNWETTITDHPAAFSVKEFDFDRIEISRIRGLITGELEPVEDVGVKIDISDFKYVPETAVLGRKSVITEYIQDRAVTGDQMFTSKFDNVVLAVLENDTSPVYTKINREMLNKNIISTEYIQPAEDDERMLCTLKAGETPVWTKITSGMLDSNIVDERIILDGSVTSAKIADRSINALKLFDEPMITESRIYDYAITTRKISPAAVTEEKLADDIISTVKIKDGAVTTDKLANEIVLPKNTSIAQQPDNEVQAIRNSVVSPELPTGCEPGLIWFQYV